MDEMADPTVYTSDDGKIVVEDANGNQLLVMSREDAFWFAEEVLDRARGLPA